jgi:hypothetical protein
MKYGPMVNVLFFLQYLVAIIIWYWLFVDTAWIRLVAGASVILHSLIIIVFPHMLPNRPGIFGRISSDSEYNAFKKYSAWVGVLFGIVILSGYRLMTLRAYGIFALVLSLALIFIHLYLIGRSTTEERLETARFRMIALSISLVFVAISIFIISKGNEPVTLFTRQSPYPMMAVFALMGIWHYFLIRKKERSSAQPG